MGNIGLLERFALSEYEVKALCYSEKYGIIDYKVCDCYMYYTESFSEGDYHVIVNLHDMKEVERELKSKKK